LQYGLIDLSEISGSVSRDLQARLIYRSVDQLDGVEHPCLLPLAFERGRDLQHASYVAGGDDMGLCARDVLSLAIGQSVGGVRLD
jgi:hypothetical protein